MNSCLIEFEDGYRVITSKNAIRKKEVIKMVVRRRKTTRKKKSKGKYDYKKIASQTKGQVKDSSERKGISGSNIFKAGQEITFFKPAADEDHTIDIVPFIAGSNIAIDMKTGEPLVEEGDWAYTY
ncbi:MAG: hypothetical protein KAQ85_08505, partial [Thermodesulfovibrionia bacterium]|nr:hypothetical protein [Thermodesulfovibrionia bacterium]